MCMVIQKVHATKNLGLMLKMTVLNNDNKHTQVRVKFPVPQLYLVQPAILILVCLPAAALDAEQRWETSV